jgi:hypothetical protein
LETDGQADGKIPGSKRVEAVYLLAQLGLLAGLVWKWKYFEIADRVYRSIPLSDPFFPDWLESAAVARWAYLGALAAIALGVVSIHRWPRRIFAAAFLPCVLILGLHQFSYNDATFTTSLWAGLWLFWFTTRMGVDPPPRLLRRAAFLGRAIGSLILLGGAVGKWTPEYWSGEVLYDIYFVERDFWTFNYLRDRYDAETLRTIATWHSRGVIVIETVCGFGMWLLPPRWAATLGVLLFAAIAVFSNWLLFSVLWCLIALSAVGFFVMKQPPAKTGAG